MGGAWQDKKLRAVDIYPDGLIAFMAAALVADVLLAGLAIFSLRCLFVARRKRERFSRQQQFPQLIGMSVSLSFCAAVMALLWPGLVTPWPPALNMWLDDLVLFWPACLLALWPVSSCAVKRLSRRYAVSARSDVRRMHGGGEPTAHTPT